MKLDAILFTLGLGAALFMIYKARTTGTTVNGVLAQDTNAPAGYEWKYSPYAGTNVLVPVGAVM